MVTLTLSENNKNMFDIGADVLVNPVNCIGVMGKGLALEFKQRYPWCFDKYRESCNSKSLLPGVLNYVKNPNSLGNPRGIINFPTKRHFRDRSRMGDIILGLDALALFIANSEHSKFAVPALGCGLGGLNWQDVLDQMKLKLSNLPDGKLVVVFGPL